MAMPQALTAGVPPAVTGASRSRPSVAAEERKRRATGLKLG